MIGMGNLGYLMIFGGCLGAGHATAGSASSASDDWLWEGNGVLPSSHAWQYANVSAGGADSSAGVTAGLDGAETKSAVVPVSAQLPMVNVPETEGVNFRYFGALITCGLNGKVQALPVISKSGKD